MSQKLRVRALSTSDGLHLGIFLLVSLRVKTFLSAILIVPLC